jgi:hypothetical protein
MIILINLIMGIIDIMIFIKFEGTIIIDSMIKMINDFD